MKHLPFTILAIFCLSASAETARSPQWRAQFNDFEGNTQGASVPNANQCAPGYARPVWGANSALVGYSCSNYANGS
jgi:hypothetical protein